MKDLNSFLFCELSEPEAESKAPEKEPGTMLI